MDVERLVDELAPTVAAGEAVLFTGAGFSSDARNHDGAPLPTTEALRDLLWMLAFGDAPLDRSQLADVYECAVNTDAEATAELLRRAFQVDEGTLDDGYRTWFSMPWCRAYTLNVDDLDEAAFRRWPMPAPVCSLSALGDELPPRVTGLLSIHLNGRVVDFPRLTFSAAQYGQRTASPDPWYQHLAMDLDTHPVVFVGTSLSEPPLWQHLALNLQRRQHSGPRPRSYLVTPGFPMARQRVLEELDIVWVPMDRRQFAEEILGGLGGAAEKGHEALGVTDTERARPPASERAAGVGPATRVGTPQG